ncbi:hypothetical protein AB0M36_10415 [Actinoplanes sp. NPDC051346]|uniref:hypothetical protein n=1 Tax=Actinoplanes sp. NPDC051346 TaxID=3155048 RepID=UPI00342BD6DE
MVWERGRKRALVVLAVAAAMAGGSACSSSEPEGGAADGKAQVATLTSAGSTPAASAKPAADARPRERLDSTEEELEVMREPYYKCVREQGATPKHEMGDKFAGQAPSGELEKFLKADKLCRPKFYPLPPWEQDPANPEAKDFARDVVKCLKGKGVKYVEVAPEGGYSLGGPNNHSESISKGMELAPKCEREVAAKRK